MFSAIAKLFGFSKKKVRPPGAHLSLSLSLTSVRADLSLLFSNVAFFTRASLTRVAHVQCRQTRV